LKTFEIPSTLQKAASSDEWLIGGVASSFHKDLDGEAITPQAVKEAIPGFMARRGADGIQGGPIQLHHGFYDRFIKQAVGLLRLPIDEQMALVAAISLPLGRVTKMWVEPDGTTKWEGVLSQANPIARIIWQMLKENLIHLGVSLGGKIFSTQPGRDSLGQLCTLITKIRIDELSITSNPALRLTNDEGTGAYITALAKSIRSAMTQPLTKADKNSAITLIPRQQSLKLDDASTRPSISGLILYTPFTTENNELIILIVSLSVATFPSKSLSVNSITKAGSIDLNSIFISSII
jgi:hypothetical protein